jgi:DNA invertase Pin-like site-specific DNA recombinase
MGRGGDDFHSPEVQLAAIRRKTIGMQEVEVIDCDIDKTGRHFDRRGIDRVRALAEAGQMDVLAVYNVARLGRNTLESLKFLNWLADRGVTIISAKQHIDTSTPSGRKHLTDLLSGAQMQSEEIGESWADIIEQRAQDGHHHGHRTTGYVKVDKKLVPDPVVGPVMTEAFKRWAAGEKSLHVVQYIAAARGKPVHVQALKRWLRMPVYRGLVVANGIEMPGIHDALMDEETWVKVQGRLAREEGMAPRDRSPSWSLVGLAWCPSGCRLYRHPGRHHQTRERIYRVACAGGPNRVGGSTCDGIGMPLLDPIEAEVLRQAREYIKLLQNDVTAATAYLERNATARVDASRLRGHLAKTRNAIIKLTTAWSLGDVPDKEYQASVAELRRAEMLTAKELAAAERAGGGTTMPDQAATEAEALLLLWPRMTSGEKNRALRSIVRKVVVRKRDYWREPEAERVRVAEWAF